MVLVSMVKMEISYIWFSRSSFALFRFSATRSRSSLALSRSPVSLRLSLSSLISYYIVSFLDSESVLNVSFYWVIAVINSSSFVLCSVLFNLFPAFLLIGHSVLSSESWLGLLMNRLSALAKDFGLSFVDF